MPTYEYVCDACGHKFEQFQTITARPTRRCPVCGKLKVRRLIGTGSGVIFKGSGFYQTDYRSEGYKSAAKADTAGAGSTAETKPSTETPAKTEPKPAAAEAKTPPAKAESKKKKS